MGIYERDYLKSSPTGATETAVRTFSQQVYGWMTIGLAFTALISLFVVRTGLYTSFAPYAWLFALGLLGISFGFSAAMARGSFTTVASLFMAYAGLEGLFFGTVLPLYAAAYGGQIIWLAFGTASVIFGSAILFGKFTHSDLTSMGPILRFGVMGLLGVTLLMVVLSFFMDVTWMHLVISYIGLVIFTGLTAYEAQQIRAMSHQVPLGSNESYKLSLMMALQMYINVVMIFWYLLQIFAARRD